MAVTKLSTARIIDLRGPKNKVDPETAYESLVERELSADRKIVSVATIFITNRECPFRCLMCDLWKNTLDQPIAPGLVPGQIRDSLEHLGPADHLKLYNSGNFFDQKAIPVEDYSSIARLSRRFQKVIVECHPKLVAESAVEFAQTLGRPLEIAMGLETVHPEILPALNKGMTTDDFRKAAAFLKRHGIGLRVFVLLKTPFMSESEGIEWAMKSVDFALDCGAGIVAVIPTRPGNGAIDQLEQEGNFSRPKLRSLEAVMDHFADEPRGVVTADLWDLEQFSDCDACFEVRFQRLQKMNLSGAPAEPVVCGECDEV